MCSTHSVMRCMTEMTPWNRYIVLQVRLAKRRFRRSKVSSSIASRSIDRSIDRSIADVTCSAGRTLFLFCAVPSRNSLLCESTYESYDGAAMTTISSRSHDQTMLSFFKEAGRHYSGTTTSRSPRRACTADGSASRNTD